MNSQIRYRVPVTRPWPDTPAVARVELFFAAAPRHAGTFQGPLWLRSDRREVRRRVYGRIHRPFGDKRQGVPHGNRPWLDAPVPTLMRLFSQSLLTQRSFRACVWPSRLPHPGNRAWLDTPAVTASNYLKASHGSLQDHATPARFRGPLRVAFLPVRSAKADCIARSTAALLVTGQGIPRGNSPG